MEQNKHFKMYKAGKLWLVASLTTILMMGGGALAVHADSTSDTSTTTDTSVTAPAQTITTTQTVNYVVPEGYTAPASVKRNATWTLLSTDANGVPTYRTTGLDVLTSPTISGLTSQNDGDTQILGGTKSITGTEGITDTSNPVDSTVTVNYVALPTSQAINVDVNAVDTAGNQVPDSKTTNADVTAKVNYDANNNSSLETPDMSQTPIDLGSSAGSYVRDDSGDTSAKINLPVVPYSPYPALVQSVDSAVKGIPLLNMALNGSTVNVVGAFKFNSQVGVGSVVGIGTIDTKYIPKTDTQIQVVDVNAGLAGSAFIMTINIYGEITLQGVGTNWAITGNSYRVVDGQSFELATVSSNSLVPTVNIPYLKLIVSGGDGTLHFVDGTDLNSLTSTNLTQNLVNGSDVTTKIVNGNLVVTQPVSGNIIITDTDGTVLSSTTYIAMPGTQVALPIIGGTATTPALDGDINIMMATLNVVDTDDNNKVVQSFKIGGQIGSLTDWSSTNDAIMALTDKYIFTGGSLGTSFKMNPADNIYQMTVTEKHEAGSVDQTLNITTSGLPSAKDVTYQAETVTYNTDTNLVTGITTYTPVKGFDAVSVQDVAGYTATVGLMPVTATSTDAPEAQTVNVSYVADAQTITVNYVDDDNDQKVVATDTLNGVTDQSVDYEPSAPTNYVLVDGTEMPSNFEGGQVITVHVTEKHTLTNYVQTINYVATGLPTAKNVSYNSSKVGYVVDTNLVTGETVYHLAKYGLMQDSDIQAVDGYTATIGAVSLNDTSTDAPADQTVNVSYVADAQTITVNYVDDDNNGAMVSHGTLNGVTDQAVSFTPEESLDNNIVPGTEIPSTFSPDGGQVITVHLTHKTSSQDEAKTVSRLVKFVDAKGNDLLPSVLQTVNFTRVATTDIKTGLVSYTAWVSDNADLNAVNAPALSGLTPDQSGAAAETLTGDSINNVVSIVYTDQTAPDAPSEAVTPVSPDGGTTTVSGTAEANSLVTVITADGTKLTQQTGDDGAYSIDVPNVKIGDVITVTATDDAGNVSDANQQSVGVAVVQKDVVDDPISVNPDDFYDTVDVEFVDQNGNVIGTSDVKITNHQDVDVNVPTGYSHLNDDGTYTTDVLINDGTDHQQVLVTKIQSQVITDDGGVTNQNGDGQITKTAVGAPVSVNVKDFYDNTVVKPVKAETHEPTLKDALVPVETNPKQGASLVQIEDSLDNGAAVLPNTGAAMQQHPELAIAGLSAFLLAITGLLAKKRQDSED